MARRIVWTKRANIVFTKLLEYYILRNKSKEYSRKLNKEIHSYLVIIAKQPFLGMRTND
jgi:toxin YoeB